MNVVLQPDSTGATTLTRRQLKKSGTTSTIKAAARHLFSRHPYHKVTIRGIAREAGLTTGALFASYKGKDDIFAAVMKDALNEQLQVMRAQFSGSRPFRRCVTECLTAGYVHAYDRKTLFQSFWSRQFVNPRLADTQFGFRASVIGLFRELAWSQHDGSRSRFLLERTGMLVDLYFGHHSFLLTERMSLGDGEPLFLKAAEALLPPD